MEGIPAIIRAMKKPPAWSDIAVYSLLGLCLAGLTFFCVRFWPDIMRVVASPQAIEDWLAGFGIWAPLVFIAVQFIQVVVFVIPGEVPQLAGGFLFGIGGGWLYSMIGIGLGSGFAFLVARKLGLAFVTRLFGATQVGRFEGFISSSRAMVGFFLLFLIPGIPKDILCYVAGLSRIPLGWFMAISLLGRIPALLGSVILGHAAAEQDWRLLIAVSVIASVLFVLGVVFRAKIHDRITALTHRSGRHPAPPAQPADNGPETYRQDD
jgi:uncharacterized membrane protein YdjX (TVP38/TMEM64 family)